MTTAPRVHGIPAVCRPAGVSRTAPRLRLARSERWPDLAMRQPAGSSPLLVRCPRPCLPTVEDASHHSTGKDTTVNAHTAHSARIVAAAGGSLLGLLLLAGPASARDIGPGDPLSAGSTSSQCRNVVPEDRPVCDDRITPRAPAPAPQSTLPDVGTGLDLEPGTLGFLALGGVALAGTALVASRHRHAHLHHPA